jgi:hypothetical protein
VPAPLDESMLQTVFQEPDTALLIRPIRPMDRVVSFVEVLFCSGLFSQVMLALLLQAAGWSPFHADGTLSLRYVTTVSLFDTAIVMGLAIYFLRSRGERPGEIFFGVRRRLREAWVGVALVPAILLAVALIGWGLRWLAPWLHNVEENPLASLVRDPNDLVVFAAVVVLAGGVREEVQRAFILHRFRQHLGGATAGLLIFSVAFGAGHVMQGYDAAILIGLLGLAWGWIYLRRGSLVAPMVSHSGFNLIEVFRQALFP